MADSFIAHARQVLKENGMLWSGPRAHVCMVLDESKVPLTPSQMDRALKERFPGEEHHNVARVLKTIRQLGLSIDVFGGNVANPFPKGTPLAVNRNEKGEVKVEVLEGAVVYGKVKSVMLLTDEMGPQ